ncbi:MAG: hypothetical protein Kow0099_20660 [Candidatus Abyssubacteria bacterium]
MADIHSIVKNLPEKVEQVILGGGEVLADTPQLYAALDALYAKFGNDTRYMIQSNGDLIDTPTVEGLLQRHVCRIDISSIDDFHNNRKTREEIDSILKSCGLKFLPFPSLVDEDGNLPAAAYSFWGSTPELWLGGVWPRGRAMKSGLWTRDPSHSFCNIWSGALGFLDNESPQQEINIRLNEAHPCCPGTRHALGDVSKEPLTDILDRYRGDPVFAALNRGEPEAMGVERGLSVEHARARIEELGSCCLWCDEFFERHYAPSGVPPSIFFASQL